MLEQYTVASLKAVIEAFEQARASEWELWADVVREGCGMDVDDARAHLSRALAIAQCTDAEVRSLVSLLTDLGSHPGQLPADVELLECRRAGRALIRLWTWSAASGEEPMSKDRLFILKEVAYQHAGWTRVGYDETVRHAIERGESKLAVVQ